jgi:LuxR family quorum sensing-dependent transcriptional regulator
MGAFIQVAKQLGVEFFAAAFVPLTHERLDAYFIWDQWPQAWLDRYLKYNYFHVDPVVSALRRTGRSILWSDMLQVDSFSSRARRVMNEAKAFGLVEGLTIPLHSRTGIGGVFSMAGRHLTLSPSEITLLEIVAERAHRHLLNAGTASTMVLDYPSITKAESECLTWCAEGKTDREIALISGRSPRTIQSHITNLQKKLGVSNRAQLVAEAFRRGLQR